MELNRVELTEPGHDIFGKVFRRLRKTFHNLFRRRQKSEDGRLKPASLPVVNGDRHKQEISTMRRSDRVWNEPTYAASHQPQDMAVQKRSSHWKMPADHASKCYPMKRAVSGHMLIIDNEHFKHLASRQGTEVDSINLAALFSQLGFRVSVLRNLSKEEMEHEITSFAKMPDHSDSDMCIVCILSHGYSGVVISTDGKEISTHWIEKCFNNKECPSLIGKPKLFIYQACRGSKLDQGIGNRTDGTTTTTDAQRMARPDMPPSFKVPTWEDFLVVHSTVHGYVSIRNKIEGTWFVQSLCKVFRTNAHHMDLRDMLDEVALELSNYESKECGKQSCSYTVTHFKKLYFNPGIQ